MAIALERFRQYSTCVQLGNVSDAQRKGYIGGILVATSTEIYVPLSPTVRRMDPWVSSVQRARSLKLSPKFAQSVP